MRRRALFCLCLSLAVTLGGCSTPAVQLTNVANPQQFAVVLIDNEYVIYSIGIDTEENGPTAYLKPGYHRPKGVVSSFIEGWAGYGQPILAWNSNNQATQLAALSPEGDQVFDLGISVDSGLVAVSGDSLAALLPGRPDSGSRIEFYSIGQGQKVAEYEASFFPDAIMGMGGGQFLLAHWSDGSITWEQVGSDGTVSHEWRQSAEGWSVVCMRWDGQSVVVFARPDQQTQPGTVTSWMDAPWPVLRVSVAINTHLCAVAPGWLTFDAGSTIFVKSLQEQPDKQISLGAVGSPLGIAITDIGSVAVLSSTHISIAKTNDSEFNESPLGGLTATMWMA